MKNFLAKFKGIFKKSKGAAAAAVICCTALILLVSFTVYASSYDKVFPNVYAGGVNLGGLTQNSAAEAVKQRIGENIASGRTVTLKCCGKQRELSFSELEASVDADKTAAAAYNAGRNGNAVFRAARLLAAVFSKTKIPVESDINSQKLNTVIDELAAADEVEPEKVSYTLEENRLTINKGHGGKKVNREAALKELAAAIENPEISELSFPLEELKAEPLDFEKLYGELTAPEKNAEYKLENGEVGIVEGHTKIIVDKKTLKTALEAPSESVSVTVEAKEPELTADILKKRLFCDTLGSFSSSFATSTAGRAKNVSLTAERINGYILMPGDEFSYDKTIGKRTYANGYRDANVYVGNKVESGIGGGICQTSSTLYSAALYANLEIVSRTSHSLPVSYVPAGQDATIAEGYIDLVLKNNTEYPVKIVASVSGRRLTCSIVGTAVPGQTVELAHSTVSTSEPKTERTVNPEIPQGYKYVISKGAPGYTVASNRIVRIDGKVVKTEKLSRSVYRAAPIEEEVNPADMDAPSEELKIYTPGMKPADNPQTQPPEAAEPDAETDKAPAPEAAAPDRSATENLPEAAEPQPEAAEPQPEAAEPQPEAPAEPETVVIP